MMPAAAVAWLLSHVTMRSRPSRSVFDFSDVEHESDGAPLEVEPEIAERMRRTRRWPS